MASAFKRAVELKIKDFSEPEKLWFINRMVELIEKENITLQIAVFKILQEREQYEKKTNN
jgi:hypothetical protein